MTTFHKMNTRLALSLTTTLIGFAPLMVNADATATHSETVRFDTTSVHSAPGARELYSHIRDAAYSVCGTTKFDVEPSRVAHSSACVNDAIARAVRNVQSPQLAQRYVEMNGVETAAKNGINSAIRTAQR